ncbi:four-helix bundle copper-binding protein [Streptomyces sp. V4I8]|uniref:four-helix bundle copper-binding protein n=1 Tax=Streptomyces sp. V4I8 TaxID=3156469 RepID=UPI003515CE0C
MDSERWSLAATIFHSDRGAEYTSEAYNKLCDRHSRLCAEACRSCEQACNVLLQALG